MPVRRSWDRVILPLAVACDRTGLTHEVLSAQWGVQEMTRTFLNSEQEIAVLVPKELLARQPTSVEDIDGALAFYAPTS
jgi:hypothetical protein